MTDVSANLSLPYIQPSQAQKHVTHNEALRRLDAVVQLSVHSAALSAPPAGPAPAEGARWIVATGGTGPWAGQDHSVALWDGTAWQFFAPAEGWQAYDRDSGGVLLFDGAGWASAGLGILSDGTLPMLGVNTTPDAGNRLAVKTDQALFSHDDITPGNGSMLLVTNKDASGDDTGLTLQTGYSTRALIGLFGDDDTVFKVSPDGSAYTTAVHIDRSSGNVAFGGAAPNTGAGTVDAGGALMVRREAYAHNTNSAYTALVLGAPGDQGGLFSVGRYNAGHKPFVALSGWDSGAARILYYGGGGWGCPDATEHLFYAAPTYTEANSTASLCLHMKSGFVRNTTPVLGAARSAKGALMQMMMLEENVATTAGSHVDSAIQIPAGAIVFNVSTRVTTAVTGAASFDLGTAADVDQFGAALGTGQNSTGLGIIAPTPFTSASSIRLSANGGTFSGGAVRIAICYYLPLPPQS